MSRVIALYSPVPQSGKSTIADHLEAEHGYARLKFAGVLKDLTHQFLLNLGIADLADRQRMVDGDLKDKLIPGLPFTPRDWQIMIGDGGRALHQDLWVEMVLNHARHCVASGQSCVVDDMRFPNEFRKLNLSGLPVHFVRVIRPGATTDVINEGQLEQEFFDRRITNDGTILSLQGRVDLMVRDDWR